MENQILQNSIIDHKIEKPFNHKTKAYWLMFASIVGVILSFAYFYISKDIISKCSFDFSGTCVEESITNYLEIKYLSLYYGVTAFVFLISSLFLLKKKKLGVVLFVFGVVLIILSMFMSTDFKISIIDSKYSVFVNSLASAMTSFIVVGNFYGSLIVISVLMYFIVIILNFFLIRKWWQLVR